MTAQRLLFFKLVYIILLASSYALDEVYFFTILSALRHTLEFADQALSILKLAKVKGHLMLFAGEPRDEDIILAY